MKMKILSTAVSPSIIFFFLIVLFLSVTTTASTTTYIQSKCKSTTYPTLCITTLTPYASTIKTSPRRLAQTALTVSLDSARRAKTSVTHISAGGGLKPREVVALKDCKEEMSDTVDRLEKSLHELRRAGEVEAENEEEFSWRMSNVETWVSAGLTDDGTCADGFTGRGMDGELKNNVRKQMVQVEELTSNALAFINQYANQQY